MWPPRKNPKPATFFDRQTPLESVILGSMRVPVALAEAFGAPFEELMGRFLVEQELISAESDLKSVRFIGRSVVPHVQKLSDLFNRKDRLIELPKETPRDQRSGLTPYWKSGSNPAHLRLAYFLSFMPPNLFRMASIWAELAQLGFRWPEGRAFRAIDFGAGPASAACGIAAGERYCPTGLPREGSWALIEQDKAVLQLGHEWAQNYFTDCGLSQWSTRPFHRQMDLTQDLLPKNAPRFNLWVMSFFLNESDLSPEILAENLLKSWSKHLEDDGVVILMEPALKAQSRRLLELRKALIQSQDKIQVILPCLGHQICGALEAGDDWCHEEATWWRPPYLREIDKQAGLDRKTLPFSYLVLMKTSKSRQEILPALKEASRFHRLVSPPHREGQDQEFFLCGESGKIRARFRKPEPPLERGDLLLDAEIRGAAQSSRVVNCSLPLRPNR